MYKRQAIALQPWFFEAYANLGTILQKNGQLDEAIQNYRTALNINEDPRGHFNLGTALRDEGKLDEAVSHFKRAIETVSYTHLDVYKRQTLLPRPSNPNDANVNGEIELARARIQISVSYTHLDVYKRQRPSYTRLQVPLR